MTLQHELADKLKRFGAAAAEEGASFYPEPCRPSEIPPERAPRHKNLMAPSPSMQVAYTTGCGSTSRVGIPYASGSLPGRMAGEIGECVVCAIDDRAYDFPRFGG